MATNPLDDLLNNDPTLILGALQDAQSRTETLAYLRAVEAMKQESDKLVVRAATPIVQSEVALKQAADRRNAAQASAFEQQLNNDPTLILGALQDAQGRTQHQRDIYDMLDMQAEQTRLLGKDMSVVQVPKTTSTEDKSTAASTSKNKLLTDGSADIKRDKTGRITNPDWVEAAPGVGARRVNGQLEVSNVKDKEGNFTMDNSWYYRSSQTHGPQATMQSQLGSIMSLPTAEAQLQAFGQLQVSVGQEMAKAHGEAVRQAEQKMGVDQLRNLLAQNEQIDRSNPAWSRRPVDSPETARVRAQLDNAIVKANSLASEFLKSNTQVAGLQAQIKTAEAFLMRSLNKEQQMDAKAAQEEIKAAAKLEAIKAQYRPVQLRRARMLDPELTGKTDDEIVQLVAQSKKAFTPEQDMVMKATEGDLLQMALGRNTAAAAVLLKEASASTGVSEEVLGRRLKELNANLDPNAMLQQMLKVYPDKQSEGYKAHVEPLMAYVRGEVKGKEEQAFARDRIFSQAMNGLQMRNTQEWISDTRSWAWPTNDQGESRIKTIVDSVSQVQGGQPVSVADIINYIRTNYPRSEWLAYSKEIKNGIRANRKEGLLTSVDAEAAAQQAEAEFTKGLVSDAMNAVLTAPKSDTWYPGNPNNPSIGLGDAYRFLFGGPLDQSK